MAIQIVNIEDDDVDHQALKRTLKKYGDVIQLSQISNTREFNAWVDSKPEVDLIILDYQFPGAEVKELIFRIKTSLSNQIPIMVLTAYMHPDIKSYFLGLGLSQVYSKNELRQLTREVVQMFGLEYKFVVCNKYKNTFDFKLIFEEAGFSRKSNDAIIALHKDTYFVIASNTGLKDLVSIDGFQERGLGLSEISKHSKLPQEYQTLADLYERNELFPGTQKIGQGVKLHITLFGEFLLCLFSEDEKIRHQSDLNRRVALGALMGLAEPVIILSSDYTIVFVNEAFQNANVGFPDMVVGSQIYEQLTYERWKLFETELLSLRHSGPEILSFDLLNKRDELLQIEASCSFIPKENGFYCVLIRGVKNNGKELNSARTYPLTYPDFISHLVKHGSEPTVILDASMAFADGNETGKRFLAEHLLSSPKKGDRLPFEKLGSEAGVYWMHHLKSARKGSVFFSFASGSQLFEIIASPLTFHLSADADHILVMAVNVTAAEKIGTITDDLTEGVSISGNYDEHINFQLDAAGQLLFTGLNHEPLQNGNFHKPVIDEYIQKALVKNLLKSSKENLNDHAKIKGYVNINHPSSGKRVIRFVAEKVIDGLGRYHGMVGFYSDITEKVNLTYTLQESQRELKKTQGYLDIISHAQSMFIQTNHIRVTFDYLLNKILEITGSKLGFICEVVSLSEREKSLKTLAVAATEWLPGLNDFFVKEKNTLFELSGIEKIFSRIISTNELIILNDIDKKELIAKHNISYPEIKRIAGLPVFMQNKLTGILFLANAGKEYVSNVKPQLDPLLSTIGTIINHQKLENTEKSTQEKLKRSELEMHAILQSIEDVVFIIDEKNNVKNIWCRDESKLLLPRERVLNANLLDIIPNESLKEELRINLVKLRDSGEAQIFNYPLSLHKRNLWFEARLHPIKLKNTVQVCIVIKDITMAKKAEQNILNNIQKEKELADLKSRFISMTSHEFRTPLTSISTSSELIGMILERENLLGRNNLNKYLLTIQSEVDRMARLMNDVLVLGKIDAGKVHVTMVRTGLYDMLESTLDKMVNSHRIPFKVEVVNDASFDEILTDTLLMEQILDNLLTNAFKYSAGAPPPVIYIHSDSKGHLILTVKDHGIGIPKEDQKRLFEQFFRAGNVGNVPGVGLGMVIVKRMVELMNAEISVSSEEGKGTSVNVKFKTAKSRYK